ALEHHLDARRRFGAAAIHAEHLPVRQQHAGRRGARACQPHDQIRPLGKGRPHGVMDAWYSVKPTAPQIAATIQKRRMIFVSDQPTSSKWWWIGAIRNTRLRKRWKLNTWIATERASITKMPPMMMSSTSFFVSTASAAIAPPRPREPVSPMKTDSPAFLPPPPTAPTAPRRPGEPVSPMKTDAGNELNQRKPTQAPTRQALSRARSAWPFVMKVMTVYVSSTIAAHPAASPSRP